MLQGSVGYDTAIPEVICADFNHRQRRWQRAAGHDVFGLNLLLEIVKVDEISGKNIDGADRKTDYLIVDYRKIDKIVERILEGPTVVIARSAPVRLSHGFVGRGMKKPRCPSTIVTHELVAFRALRKMSPSGV